MCRPTSTSSTTRAREVSGLTELETRISQAPAVPSRTDRNQPRKQPLSDSYDDLYIVSHNLRGAKGSFDPDGTTRDLNKFEVLTRLMTEHNIDIYLLQETWLVGDWITNIHGITVIHHGPKERASNRGSGGVAIMLARSKSSTSMASSWLSRSILSRKHCRQHYKIYGSRPCFPSLQEPDYQVLCCMCVRTLQRIGINQSRHHYQVPRSS